MIAEDKETIGILLASYNGGKFIADQIESLLAQCYTNWKLFIRDDGSSDDTLTIINEYAAKDERICIVRDNRKNLGSCQNFATLLSLFRAKFRYIMFCDQDDFWLPFKVKETLDAMQLLEKQHKEVTPLLVYTNFLYVNSSLETIESKKNFQATKFSKLKFAHLLAQNPAYGCTMMINKPLAEVIGHIPLEAENHDYWVTLVASAFGKIGYLNKQTLLYRQHSNNISTNYDSNSVVKRLKRIILQRGNFKDVRAKVIMASAFKAAYFTELNDAEKKILNEFISFTARGSIAAVLRNIKNGIRRQTLAQTFLFYVSAMLLKKK